MEDWQQRVIEERDQLEGRVSSLKVFIGSDRFHEIDSVEQGALNKQEQFMDAYLRVLNGRIDRFDKPFSGDLETFESVVGDFGMYEPGTDSAEMEPSAAPRWPSCPGTDSAEAGAEAIGGEPGTDSAEDTGAKDTGADERAE